jgi:restriction system protein
MSLDAILKGFGGELKTRFINWLFLGEDYKIFNNILIEVNQISTQIDHIIVSKYGIFAVETKDKTGWIFGDEFQPEWTQTIFGHKQQFQNPLRQNYRHTKSLSELLDIDHEKIHSLIIFWGDCEFKTNMPLNVIKGGLFNGKFKEYILSKRDVLLSQDEIDRISLHLAEAKNNSGLLNSLKHTHNLKTRYDSVTKCPKCGGELIERTAKSGQNTGKNFLGCSNYPKCRYSKNI